MADFRVEQLSARHPSGPTVVHDVSFMARAGAITALLGPNGAGKSTLLKACLGLVPHTGAVWSGDVRLDTLPPTERARRVAYVPQKSALMARLTVHRVVELGRFAHRSPFSRATSDDKRAVDAALDELSLGPIADRAFPDLSGGEQQRVLLARALATGAPVLLLDEPTSALDIRQSLVLERVLQRLRDDGRTLVVVLHHLDHALDLANDAVLLSQGRVFRAGPIADVVAPAPIQEVYGVHLTVEPRARFVLPPASQGRQ